MNRIYILPVAIMLMPVFNLNLSAQKLSKWEKQQLKEEKKQLREYDNLDKENAKADKEAIASLQKGMTRPFVERLNYYYVRNATVFYGSGTGYNSDRDEKNWGTAQRLIDAVKVIPGAYTVELERATDSLLLQRTGISLIHTQGFDSFAVNNVISTLKYLRKKDYSPEVNIRLAGLYKNGFNVFSFSERPDGLRKSIWIQSFDSAYKFLTDAAVAGSPDAMGMLADLKIYGDGSIFERPSPATYKYLDTISAGIWYKKQFDALHGGKPGLSLDDSLSSYILYKMAFGADDLDEKGVEYYDKGDHKRASIYWLASMKFRNSAYGFYRIGFLYWKGEGGMIEHVSIARDYLNQAGNLGMAAAYYAAAMTWEFGAAERGTLLAKATTMGYKKAADALSRDNMRIAELNRIYIAKTTPRNYYSDDDNTGDQTSLKKGNNQSSRSIGTRACSSCGGSGQQHTTIPGGAKKNGVTIFGEYHTCSNCNGKGYY